MILSMHNPESGIEEVMGMEKILFLILAGGRGTRLTPLTDNCPKPLVRFGFSKRLIDFTLYNCLISSAYKIILLTQYLSEMIEQYIPEFWKPVFEMQGKTLRVTRSDDSRNKFFSGTADAVYQTLSDTISLPRFVVVLAADHIYRMDYRSLVRFHIRHGKIATVGAVPCDRDQAHRFGIINCEQDGTIQTFHEKPRSLDSIVPPNLHPLASMGIYVFSTEPLLEYLETNQRKTSNDLGKDVLPDMVESHDASVFPFLGPDGERSYWRDVGELSFFREATKEYIDGQYKHLQFDHLPGMIQLPSNSSPCVKPGAGRYRAV